MPGFWLKHQKYLELTEALFNRFPNNTLGMKNVVTVLEKQPSLLHLNPEHVIHVGYANSLKNNRSLNL